MLKKLFKFFVILLLVFTLKTVVFSESIIPVENVFLDIKSDYKYHLELQTLYDKWIVEPESDHKFHPDKLLNRDEFVGIATETSCKKCIIPNTGEDLLNKYEIEPFFDVWLNNKYFYCISDAKENNFVLGYNKWVKCNNWIQKDWETPFCTGNNIKLEEALAVIMRMWWIMTIEEANKITSWIEKWQQYPDLSFDVKSKFSDGTVNSFYPYFKKALEYEVIDYDHLWNKKIYKLVERQWDYLRPTTLITKQDFLKMAFVALKANSCIDLREDSLAIKIDIFDKTCNLEKIDKWQCDLSDLKDDENIFDFNSEVWGICEKGIDEFNWYVWRFVNEDTWEQIIKYWKFIDDYNFLKPWKYKVFLRVTDKCWNTWEVYNSLVVSWDEESLEESDLKVSIEADPIVWNWPLEVDLIALVNGWNWPYEYKWDFWDWNLGEWEVIKHVFIEEWVYEVLLTVIDGDWNVSVATVLIKVLNNICSNDSDFDWINDCLDECSLVNWVEENNWCPIFIKEEVSYNVWKCLEEQKNSWYIFWNVICSSCPCSNSIDFRATLRECDTVIPAITSTDEKDIFSRWKVFQIRK